MRETRKGHRRGGILRGGKAMIHGPGQVISHGGTKQEGRRTEVVRDQAAGTGQWTQPMRGKMKQDRELFRNIIGHNRQMKNDAGCFKHNGQTLKCSGGCC
eukprot:12460581-Heterocapsa_arctica.AAC.1